mgnify:CR=1 FL=1
MKLYTADRETGTFIQEINSIEEGLELIREYEEGDKEDGYEPNNFYDIVNEYHESVLC